MSLFSTKINTKYSYVLKRIEKGEMIPLVSDIMFYTMLNNSKRKKYASYLLSLIINEEYEKILNNIEFMNTKLDKDNYYEKGMTVDLVVKFDEKIYNIELNNNQDISRLERNIGYAGKLYESSSRIGREYNYNYVYQININNFNFEGNKEVVDKYKLKNNRGNVLTDKLTFVHIFLPLVREKYYNESELSELEKLLLVFNEEDSERIEEFTREDKIMGEYRKDAKDASRDSEVLGLYNRAYDEERIRQNDIKRKTEEAREEGIREGKKEGIQEGIQEGIEQKQLEIIRNMIKENIDDKIISKVTGITLEELNNIKTKD